MKLSLLHLLLTALATLTTQAACGKRSVREEKSPSSDSVPAPVHQSEQNQPVNPSSEPPVKAEDTQSFDKPVIQLLDAQGSAYCSGVLINRQVALTAASCLLNNEFVTVSPDTIKIRTSTGHIADVNYVGARPVSFASTHAEDLDMGFVKVSLPEDFKTSETDFPTISDAKASLKVSPSYYIYLVFRYLPGQVQPLAPDNVFDIIGPFGPARDSSDFSILPPFANKNDGDVPEILYGNYHTFCNDMRGAPLFAADKNQKKTLVGIVSRALLDRREAGSQECAADTPLIATKAGWFRYWRDLPL